MVDIAKKEAQVEASALIKVEEDSITLDMGSLNRAESWEDFISLWTIAKEIDNKNQWFKGEIVNRVSIVYGESNLKKFAGDIKEKETTLDHYRRVVRAFPPTMRNYNLTWTHYLLASFTDSFNKGENKFDTENRYKWIDKANDEGWSTTRMTEEVKKENALVKTDFAVFDYYYNYLDKVENILTHIEKDKLQPDQPQKLLARLLAIHDNLKTYFGG